jgi:SAM-dependent methyltransferase
LERIDCLICSSSTDSKPAQIAPFLSHYCQIEETTTNVRYCRQCDLAFFQRRLTDEDARRIYTNYRGEEYTRERLKVEPTYVRFVAPFNDPLSSMYTDRVRDYVDFLDVFPELEAPGSVLDFGGDGSIPARVFSGSHISIDDLNAGTTDKESQKYDLVFASNVFEHVSDPVSLLRSLVQKISPEGVLFIDVPGSTQASLHEGILWQERHGGELFEMHEHINHFSKRSLRLLIESAGLETFFEFRARYGAIAAVAAFPDSQILKKLRPEQSVRSAHLESKLARAEASDAARVSRAASQSVNDQRTVLNGQVAALQAQLGNLDQRAAQVRQKPDDEKQRLETELAAYASQIQEMRRSTSWRVTSPIRAMKSFYLQLAGKA